jgi:hypothetical protein
VAQGVGPEFKPQYPKKKKKTNSGSIVSMLGKGGKLIKVVSMNKLLLQVTVTVEPLTSSVEYTSESIRDGEGSLGSCLLTSHHL